MWCWLTDFLLSQPSFRSGSHDSLASIGDISIRRRLKVFAMRNKRNERLCSADSSHGSLFIAANATWKRDQQSLLSNLGGLHPELCIWANYVELSVTKVVIDEFKLVFYFLHIKLLLIDWTHMLNCLSLCSFLLNRHWFRFQLLLSCPFCGGVYLLLGGFVSTLKNAIERRVINISHTAHLQLSALSKYSWTSLHWHSGQELQQFSIEISRLDTHGIHVH